MKSSKIPYSCPLLDNIRDFIIDTRKGIKQTKRDYDYALRCIEKVRKINEDMRMQLLDSNDAYSALFEIKEIMDDYNI